MSCRSHIRLILVLSVGVMIWFAGCSKNSTGDDVAVDDGTAPTDVSDLAVASFSDTSVTLTWTATGDDSTQGTAANYDLRMSTTMIHYANFDSAAQISGLPAPQVSGSSEQFEVRGLKTDSTYYFALRVTDERGNYNGISNCVHATCFNDFVVTIPDTNLLAAIRNQISKPTGDILKSDMMGMLDLIADDEQITDLTGLEYATNLVVLNIIGNSVSDLTPLTHLSHLTQIHAGGNAIADLSPLAGKTGLAILNLNLNHITDLSPVSGLVGLAHLDLSYNRIRNIDRIVDNTGIGSGDYVSLTGSPLDHESIMTYIPTLRNRGVTVIWPANTVPPGAVSDLAVDTVTSNSVRLQWTASGEDNYEGIAYHYEMRFSKDRSEIETWSGGQALAYVPGPDTAGTPQSVMVAGLLTDTTYYFGLKTQDNSENWSAVSNIISVQPYVDTVVTFADAALEAAVRDAISKPTGDIHRSDLLSLDSLNADSLGIMNLTGLEYCTNLRYLRLVDDNVSDITPLTDLISLQDLNLQGNNVSDISALASLGNLGVLQLNGNPLGSFDDLSTLSSLQYLSAVSVGVSDLQPLSSLTNLEYLFVPGNGISDLSPLTGCTQLKLLYADVNSLVDISPLSGLTNLMVLSLTHNSIQDISPLVDNAGIGSGDQVHLDNNPLSLESINTHIPALEARGVAVSY